MPQFQLNKNFEPISEAPELQKAKEALKEDSFVSWLHGIMNLKKLTSNLDAVLKRKLICPLKHLMAANHLNSPKKKSASTLAKRR